jgi:hypothetical protein
MGPDYDGHIYGRSGGYDLMFLDETVHLGKELQNKKFEYFEETRNPVTGTGKVTSWKKRFSPFRKSFTKRYPLLHREAGNTATARKIRFYCRVPDAAGFNITWPHQGSKS